MKRVCYFFFVVLILSTVSCTNNLKQYKLDMLICESSTDNKLTEEQLQILLPKEKNDSVFLAQGNIFNNKGKISYIKEKGFWDKFGGENANVNSPFFVLKEEVNSHLAKLDLSTIYLAQPLSKDDVKSNIANYDVVLGYGPLKSLNSSTYSFKFFTTSASITSYITDTILVKNPGAKIVVVCNPPITKGPIPPEGQTAQPGNSLPEAEPLRQELLKIIDTKRPRQEREKIAAQVWDEYFYPDVYVQNSDEFWNPGNGKSYLAHLVTLPSIIDICILKIERDKETNKISGLKVIETRNSSFITN